MIVLMTTDLSLLAVDIVKIYGYVLKLNLDFNKLFINWDAFTPLFLEVNEEN
ncbi:MAG: hypothetical protein HQK50_19510 [Oligoflexia bacterium]|nr:hypothetical protein [Oligoflexia bacterium]MBF0367764.1 hypothetical protein [Oligoflexia bacterium]